MADAVQTLRDKRARAWEQAKEYRDANEAGFPFSAEDEAAWTRALDECDALSKQIDAFERSTALDARFKEIDDATTVVTDDGSRSDADADKAAYREAFVKFVRGGTQALDDDQRAMLQAQYRALGEATGAPGGYTVPEGFWAKVTETMKAYGGAEEGAEVITTATGNPLPWPTNDDTGNTGELIAENTQHNEQDVTFGQKNLSNYTFSSKIIRVSLQLLQDSGVDIEAFVAKKLGQRLGRVENTYFTTGTGSSQPAGYINGGSTGVTTTTSQSITYDNLVDLVHSVDPAYRASGNCRFKLHDLTLAVVRKLRDDSGGAGVGRPIWEPSVQAGVPSLLLGYPYTVNQDQAAGLGASNKAIAFGDFSVGFVIRRIAGGQLLRLTERYADYLQVGFLGFERADSVVQDASAYKLLVLGS